MDLGISALIGDYSLPKIGGVPRAKSPFLLHSPIQSLSTKIPPAANDCSPFGPSLTPPLMTMAHLSDAEEDSVCADIDRWACSSLEEEEYGFNGTVQQSGESTSRIKELEQQQQRLNESVLQLSTHFAQVQFRIQQIAQAPAEQRNEMIRQLQEFASRSCIDMGAFKPAKALDVSEKEPLAAEQHEQQQSEEMMNKTAQMRQLISELRQQLTELEQFAWQNGQLSPGEMPLQELRSRQLLMMDKLREKMRLPKELLDHCQEESDMEQFRQRLEQNLENALNPLKEKDQLVSQLHTQIIDLEQYVQFLQKEVAEVSPIASSDESPLKGPLNAYAKIENGIHLSYPKLNSSFNLGNKSSTIGELLGRWFPFGSQNGAMIAAQNGTKKNFERNELKNTPLGNHYGDQRAELELAVHELVSVLSKNQILALDRPERAALSVDELNSCILDGVQEAVLSSVRKHFCPALKALLEHGLRPAVAPSPRPNALLSAIGCFPDQSRRVNSRHFRPDISKFDMKKLEHIWDVISLFVETSRALEMRDAVVGQLSDAFKLENVAGKTATSKQILLCTIEHINSSHGKLRRSSDTMWKAFVCAAMNRNRLPAWIRIIFRSEIILTKCYNTWSYVARTGVEDIRPLLEGLHAFNFDLPVDLAVRPFEHIKEAFG